MNPRLRKGFTLIELMIVVAIIGILAAIAIPNFIRYQLKSKEGEARTVTGGIKTSEEAFRAEYDNYIAWGPLGGDNVDPTTKGAWTIAQCAGNCGRGANLANCTSVDCIGYAPSGPTYFSYQTFVIAPGTTPGYTVEAISDLDADTVLNHWNLCTDNMVRGTCDVPPTMNTPIAAIPGEITNATPGVF